jgi:hypothetical protein
MSDKLLVERLKTQAQRPEVVLVRELLAKEKKNVDDTVAHHRDARVAGKGHARQARGRVWGKCRGRRYVDFGVFWK